LALEKPKPEADLIGYQRHFLERIGRCSEEAQHLALKLYYNFAQCRYIARAALRMPEDRFCFERDPGDLVSRRVVVELEPGRFTSKLIMDGRGKLLTCLSPDMAAGSRRLVTFDELQGMIAAHGRWVETQRAARAVVGEVIDPYAMVLEILAKGWHTPRETLGDLRQLGPAMGPLLSVALERANLDAFEASVRATHPVASHEGDLQAWFRATGAMAAFMTLMADQRIEPHPVVLSSLLAHHGGLIPMVAGACLAWLRPTEGYQLIFPNGEERLHQGSPSELLALATYLGTLYRVAIQGDAQVEEVAELSRTIDVLRDQLNGAVDMVRRQGRRTDPLSSFVRELAILSGGGRPPWGEDLAGDPEETPAMFLEDYCRPDGSTSIRPLRWLAQRLLSADGRPLWHLFQPQANLDGWCRIRKPLQRNRTGTFSFPWAQPLERPSPRPELPGRNDPCSCGSGRKFKRCCQQGRSATDPTIVLPRLRKMGCRPLYATLAQRWSEASP
jgi:hypothetical protein